MNFALQHTYLSPSKLASHERLSTKFPRMMRMGPDSESERCWLLSNPPPMTESGSTALLFVVGAAISSFVTRWSVGCGA